MAQAPVERPVTSNPAELLVWLRDGWLIMLRHFPALVLVALLSDLPLSLIALAADAIDSGWISFLVTVSSIAVITPVAKAVAIVAIDRWERGERDALKTAFGSVLRRLPVVLAASALWCLCVLLGVALFVVPGIVVLMLGQCLMGALVVEGCSIGGAVRRSLALVKSRFYSVLALFVVVQVAAGLASSLLVAILGAVLDGWFLDLVTRALSSPLAFAPLAVLFLRARVATDGMAAAAAGSSSSAPG